MISYIKGELSDIGEETIVVECGGIGYEIRVPLSVLPELPGLGQEVKIHTILHVREEEISLFGFLTRDELETFRLLIRVSGIGPKGALGILSAISPDELRMAVLAGDEKAIARAPGIGKKTAGRLILELKDKLKLSDAFPKETAAGGAAAAPDSEKTDVRSDAAAALTALGYSGAEAMRAVRQVELTEAMTTEDVLRQSLKIISRL